MLKMIVYIIHILRYICHKYYVKDNKARYHLPLFKNDLQSMYRCKHMSLNKKKMFLKFQRANLVHLCWYFHWLGLVKIL